MTILGIIPARGGSKGIPNKNIKLLNGKPLIAYTIEAALASQLDRVIVSTDCNIIAKVAKKYGAEVAIRSAKLAQDDTPTLPVLQDLVSELEEVYDAIMTLQPTSPLRKFCHINEAITLFQNDAKADSLVSVVDVPHNYSPEKLMFLKEGYLQGSSVVKRRQEIDVAYARNGSAIYITRTPHLKDYIFGGNILPYFMSKISSFDIDDMEDWVICEKIISCN